MPEWPLARCRSCNAPIVWGLTSTGKRMPADAEPVVGGNTVLTAGADGPEFLVVKEAERLRRLDQGDKLHVSHFTTCADSGSWRRR